MRESEESHPGDINFKRIDANMKSEHLETKLREMLVELVMPIVTLAKKNLVHNAHKNTKIEEMRVVQQETHDALTAVQKEVTKFQELKPMLQEFMIEQERARIEQNGKIYLFNDQIDKMTDRLEETNKVRLEMRSQIMNVKNKNEESFGLITQLREYVTRCNVAMNKNIAAENEKQNGNIAKNTKLMTDVQSTLEGQRKHLDSISAQATQCVMKVELAEKRMKAVVDEDLRAVTDRLKSQSEETSKAINWYGETNMKLDQALKRLEPLHERMRVLEQFTQKSVPLMTHLQISDFFQEFLCVKDQVQLIEYDNERLTQLNEALIQEHDVVKDDAASPEKDQKIEKRTAKSQKEIDHNKLLHVRLQSLMQMMGDEQQGCIRFQFGRDWNVRDFKTVEEAQDLTNIDYEKLLRKKKGFLTSLLTKET